MKLGINNISNEVYHSDRGFLSSSCLKMLHKDPQEYYKKYILNQWDPVKNQAALDFGTAAHLMLLEPHLFESSIATFPGPIRRGKQFDDFKAANAKKLILTESDLTKLTTLKETYESQFENLLNGCLFEHSLCGELSGVPIKTRCDAINVDTGIIYDVKTTSYASDTDSFKSVLFDLYYDLSAATYCEVAKQIYNRPFVFYFIVLSKSDLKVRVYKTSKETYQNGIMRMNEALEIYKKCKLTNVWEHAKVVLEDIEEV